MLRIGSRRLDLRRRTAVMGILNVTPDSFYERARHPRTDEAVEHGLRLVEEGADILDVGGESAWGGAASVDAREEQRRVLPVIEALSPRTDAPISVETRRASTAAAALAGGATMVNDVTGLGDPRMAETVARAGASACIMHVRGAPRRYPRDFRYRSLPGEVVAFLDRRARKALARGLTPDRIVIDPGIEFGKLVEHDLDLLRRLDGLRVLGFPVLVGVSRKSFIGHLLGLPAEERLEGTAAAVAFAVWRGANIVRVHDVRRMVRVIRMTEALLGGRFGTFGTGVRSDGHVLEQTVPRAIRAPTTG